MFKKKKNWILISLLSVFLIYFVIIAIYDYKIASMIGNSFANSWFSLFFDKIGALVVIFPIYIIFLAYLLKFISREKFNNIFKISTIVVFDLIYIALSFYLFFSIKNSSNDLANKISTAIMCFLLTLLIILISYIWIKLLIFNNIEQINKIFYCANISIIFMLLCWINLILFKYIFGRNRPEAVIELKNPFQYVFQINFIRLGKQSTSFPSGHTMAMGQLVIFIYFVSFKNKKWENIFKVLLFSIVIILTLLMACSRMIMQKHFITDVSFSMFLLVLYYLVSPIIVEKIYKRIKANG
ncbi:phosphatase PAP2 family protein [Spiroplasma floricola]|uniref:PAP2 family protein n=1 Tax=Spiroplasma floricola 23-6 TaxID=1336749 RepID=A0A2K8SD88_9MOLU|nr:phosphatase PAP2 family protein [Spiroplasma floricola]AUB31295.1 PAP2 family protein [Spiroplasma floricola 23-6]